MLVSKDILVIPLNIEDSPGSHHSVQSFVCYNILELVILYHEDNEPKKNWIRIPSFSLENEGFLFLINSRRPKEDHEIGNTSVKHIISS